MSSNSSSSLWRLISMYHTRAPVFIPLLGLYTFIYRDRSRLRLLASVLRLERGIDSRRAQISNALHRSFCCKYRIYFQSLCQNKSRSCAWYQPQTRKIPFLTAGPDHLVCLCTSFISGNLLIRRMLIMKICYFDNQPSDCARNVSIPNCVEKVE
jgi:hypothetical protein